MLVFLSFMLALFATMIMIPPLIALAVRYGFVDKPNQRKVHTKTIPRIGGLAFFLGAVLPILLWLEPSRQAIAFWLGGSTIVLFGLVDDRLELGYRVKLIGQILGSLIVVMYGGIQVVNMPALMGGENLPMYVSVPLTVFMVVSVTNAVNFSDGLDGLAGGVVLASLAGIAVMGFESEKIAIAVIAVTLVGSILGFLQFNSHPARLFMGDGGSQFLGFSLAVLAIWLTQGEYSAYAVSLPLLLIGLPLIDIVMVTLHRKLDGKSAFEPDKTHFHHRMLSLGLDHMEAVLVIYLLQIGLVLSAYFLRFSANSVIIGLYASLLVLYFLVFRNTDWIRQQFRPHQFSMGSSVLAQRVNYLRKGGGFPRISCFVSFLSIAGFYVYGVFAAQPLSQLPALLALVLFCAIAFMRLYIKNEFTEWAERIAYYGSALVLVLMIPAEIVSSEILFLFFLALAIVVFIGMHYAEDARVKSKPLDILIVVLVLVLPRVLGSLGIDDAYAYSAFYLVVLFYGIEMLLMTSMRYCGRQQYLKTVLILPLLLMGIASLMLA